jgi:thioredoxin-related protein
MNKILALCIAAVALFAEGVEWRTWETGLAEAETSGKVIMIDVVRNNCHYCVDMDREVFSDAIMADYIEARFVPVKVNLSHDAMPLALEVPMTPSFYFVTSGKEVVKMIPGSWNQEDFKSLLEGVNP